MGSLDAPTAALCAPWRALVAMSPHTGSTAEILDITSAVKSGNISYGCTRDESTIPRGSLTLDCCALRSPIGSIIPRIHEVRLYRGSDSVVSLAGPILNTVATGEEFSIFFAGRSWWIWNRRKYSEINGDITDIYVGLYNQANDQGELGITVDHRKHDISGATAVEAEMIGTDLQALGPRWAERGYVIQVGPQPYATHPTIFTDSDFVSPPAISIDGEHWASAISNGRRVAEVSGKYWGNSFIPIDTDPDIQMSTISSSWNIPTTSGFATITGPRRSISTGDNVDGVLSNSLKSGTPIYWDQIRAGGIVRVAITECGQTFGTELAPMSVNVTNLSVEFGENMTEKAISFEAKEGIAA